MSVDFEEVKGRVYKLGMRLGISSDRVNELPATMWQVPFLEKMLDAIEHLEDKVYVERDTCNDECGPEDSGCGASNGDEGGAA